MTQFYCYSSFDEDMNNQTEDNEIQHQQQGEEQQQDDKQLLLLPSSKPQMEKGLTKGLPDDQGENKRPDPEENRSGHASSGYQGPPDRDEKGGTSGTVEHGIDEKPGNDIPTLYDATYSDEEDDNPVEHPDFEFFWLKSSPFSQWYPTHFVIEDRHFVTAEQFMMYQKAVIFDDFETAKKILKERNPRKQQKLGREARNFNSQKWKDVCLKIVKKANYHKFSQNVGLKNHLFSTYPKILVEASPYDRIWGIGRAASDPKAQKKETWLGCNLLGYALTDVRNEMMMKENIIPADAPTFLAESALIDIENFD
ncbi:hypothetical protein ACJMK2_041750 [Sinanodonta woodiana]|uniref:NADAR domain-containing protein n=1 Tax=Sinanodonta woodiana TaxID=1069815 RepID=A0ABD3W837_SINWO